MNIDELVDNFKALDEWEDRYAYLISLGEQLPSMDIALKTPASKVPGCMSQVWMVMGWDADGRLTLAADSDAALVKGLIAIVEVIFVGKTKAEAAAVDVPALFSELGLDQHISPNRRNGFYSMVEKVRAFTGV